VYFTAIGYILRALVIFYGHWLYFTEIWYFLRTSGRFPHFGKLLNEKSGNRGYQLQDLIRFFSRFFEFSFDGIRQRSGRMNER
jgi:hypothetical protein